jgi:hypothetical protein
LWGKADLTWEYRHFRFPQQHRFRTARATSERGGVAGFETMIEKAHRRRLQ